MSFNTEHIRITADDKLLGHFKDYLEAIDSPVKAAEEGLLERIIKANAGARTLADIEKKSRFIFVDDKKIEFEEKAVKKVLLKHDGYTEHHEWPIDFRRRNGEYLRLHAHSLRNARIESEESACFLRL